MFSKGSSNLALEVERRFGGKLEIEVSKFGSFFLVNVSSHTSNRFIVSGIATGISRDADLALSKALSEFVERRAMNFEQFSELRDIFGSDGLAAMPVSHENSAQLARENAKYEAIERSLWAQWWDVEDSKFEIVPLNPHVTSECSAVAKLFNDWFPGVFQKISIAAADLDEATLEILVYSIDGKGYLSGGAVKKNEKDITWQLRAAGELLRHGMAFRKMIQSPDLGELSFYENRLWRFASGQLNSKVQRKLSATGSKEISVGRLEYDHAVTHPNSDLYVVWRCLFENQPIFMGGEVDRFCL